MNKQNYFTIPPNAIYYLDEVRNLLLRPLKLEDALAISQALQLSLPSLLPFMPWAHGDMSELGQRKRIKNLIKNYKTDNVYDFGVFDQKTNEFLLSASWTRTNPENMRTLEIGYWTAVNHSRKGLATLTAKIFIVTGFEYMNAEVIEVFCKKNNKNSIKVIENCGFNFEKEIENYYKKPTNTMVLNGYIPCQTALSYSITSRDKETLSWYDEIKKNIIFS